MTTIVDWLNNSTQKGTGKVTKDITLGKENWSTTVSDWVDNPSQKGTKIILQDVGLAKNGWDTVSEWTDKSVQRGTTVVNQKVGLTQQNTGTNMWNTVSEWVSGLMGKKDIIQQVGLAPKTGSDKKSWTTSVA